MVISQGPSGTAMLQAVASHRLSKVSPVIVLAVAASAALHLAGVLYLYTMKWTPPVDPVEPSRTPIVFQKWIDPVEVTPDVPRNRVARTTNTPRYDTPTIAIPAEPEVTDKPQVISDVVEDFGRTPPVPIIEPPRVIGRPQWIDKPSGLQLSRAYPRRAQDAGVSGSATLNCVVEAAGTVRDCAVISETPTGWGFGEAAVKLSRFFRMKPETSDGMPVDGAKVMVPLSFRMAG